MLNGKVYLNKETNIIYEKIPFYGKNYLVINQISRIDDPNFVCDKHWHRSIEIIISYTSSINACINGINYFIPKNKVLLINSKMIHSCTVQDSEEVYKGVVIQISYDYLISKYKKINNMIFPVMFNSKDEEKIIYCVNGLKEEMSKNDSASQFMKEGLINIIIAVLMRNQMKYEHLDFGNQKETQWNVILSYMEQNYDKIDSIENLAEKFNYSYGYLARSFKLNFGVSIKCFLTSLKLEKSLNDVLFTNKKILDIALEYGFTSVQSYNREFKKIYHITPTDYRKNVRK